MIYIHNDNLFEEEKIKILKLYYEKKLSKVKIAKKLKLSRFKVARILENSMKEGLVEIIIKSDFNDYLDLAEKVEDKFKLKQVVICEYNESQKEIKKNLGKSAAKLLMNVIEDNDNIGIAWGETLYNTVNAIPKKTNLKNIKIIQITGGFQQLPPEINAMDLARSMANKLNAKAELLLAPAILADEESMKFLLREPGITDTIKLYPSINIALFGVGEVLPEPSTFLYKSKLISKEIIMSLVRSNAIGEIYGHFYDLNGNICSNSLEKRIIGMKIEQLKEVEYSICVAGGKNKHSAIKAALVGNIAKNLVTDIKTAQYLLES